MAIDYRKEVDSGYDRKRIIESSVVALLNEGIPLEFITKSKEFNFKHLEMVRNLEKGYKSKENEILETYGGYGKELSEQIVPDRYSGVSHTIGGELYPMEAKEEKEKFKERDECIAEIEKLQKNEIKELEQERNKLIDAIAKYKTQLPIIEKIIETINEIDKLKASNMDNPIELTVYTALFEKNGLNPKDLSLYDKIYNDYKKLINQLDEVTMKYENALDNKIRDAELERLIEKKNIIETEIIQRNTKLINGFIRQKYKSLLIETDDLFQVCYIAIWKAVKNFDYKQGFKFSTFAYECMEREIKSKFKELTGYNWENYWMKKKVTILVKSTSETLGKRVSIDELVQYGLLDIEESKALGYFEMAEEYTFSDLVPYDEYKVESPYAQYFKDEDIDNYESGNIEQIIIDAEAPAFLSLLKEEINDVLSSLTEREKLVLILRFGLNGDKPKTLGEIGKIINRANETIRRIESMALRKLRHPKYSRRLKDYLNVEEEYSEKKTTIYRK